MLATASTLLKGNETFEEAMSLIKNNKLKYRHLYSSEGKETNIIQMYDEEKDTYSYPKTLKRNKDGSIILPKSGKERLTNTKTLYSVLEKPTHAGSNNTQAWLVGDINNFNILDEEYNVQGLIVSTIFDPIPKFYISFERIVCENQFGSLGTNSSSFYFNANHFLTNENSDKLVNEFKTEIEKELITRKKITDDVLSYLRSIKISNDKIDKMFCSLTIDKITNKTSASYEEALKKYYFYKEKYDCDDNQNYKGTFLGFINTCTNVKTRTLKNPLDVIKPVISPSIIKNPYNLDYLCRDAIIRDKEIA